MHYLLVAVVSLCRCAGAPPFVCQAKTAPRKAVVRRYRRRARRKHSDPPRAPPDAGEAWHHCCSKVCSSCWQRHFGMQQCLARAPSKVWIHFRLRGLPFFPRMLVGGATGRPGRGECTLSVYRTGALHCFKCTWSVYRTGALHCTVSNVAVADGRDSNERHATKGTLA